MKLNEIRPAKGSTANNWRRGRGPGSGNGKTAGRGSKGQLSRRGSGIRPGFEGGQMPIYRRLPKRGFWNPFRVEYSVVNTGRLEELFEAGVSVSVDDMKAHGLVRKSAKLVKILAAGDLSKALTISAHRVSKAAQEKIEAAGGKVEIIPSR